MESCDAISFNRKAPGVSRTEGFELVSFGSVSSNHHDATLRRADAVFVSHSIWIEQAQKFSSSQERDVVAQHKDRAQCNAAP
jgi:hypothetical protein